MKKLAMTLVTILVVAALASSVFAFGPDWGRGHGMGNYYGKDASVMSELNLTAEQTTKINALRETFLKDIKPLKDTLFSKRGDLKLLWLQKTPDQDKILAVQKGIRDLQGQMQDKATSQRLEVLKILTPEQQKFKSYRPGGMRCGVGWYGDPGRGMKGNW